MPGPTYERLPREGGSLFQETGLSDEPGSPQRPRTYYGDGAFDPPSSDEEEDALLEKDVPGSPGLAERGDLGEDNDDREMLVVGKAQKRALSLKRLLISLAAFVFIAGACRDVGRLLSD